MISDASFRLAPCALVLAGGFLRGAFQVGVVEVLDAIGLRFDIVIGVSSGAWNAACVVAGQVGDMRRLWMEVGAAPKFSLANLWRNGTPLNFRTIVDAIPARAVRFERLARSRVRLLIRATRLRGWAFELFDSAAGVHDFFPIVMASNYLPGIYGAPISIGGRYYADGGFTDNVPYEYEAALRLGAERVIVAVADEDGALRKNHVSRRPHRIDPAVGKRLTIIHPRRPLAVGRLWASAHAVHGAIEAGREAATAWLSRGITLDAES